MSCSHRLSQLPLKPVWPVTMTLLPCQNAPILDLVPRFPRCLLQCPQLFEMVLVTQGIHRMPEAFMPVGGELAFLGESSHGLLLPHGGVTVYIVEDFGRQN